MSGKKGEKRKPAPLLDYLAIKASTTANRGYINEVREKISALNNVDFERLLSMSGICDVSEDEALQLLACKLSVDGLNNLRNSLRHVPKNITRVVNGIPLRTSLIHKLFTTMTTTRTLSIEELSMCIQFMETFCVVFVGQTDSDEHLWRLTNTEDFSYNKFLTPPVSMCILCENNLTIRNNPSKANLFTLEGPVPCTKITLECRGCAHVYGVCNYTDKSGTHFYPHVVELVEISDVTYMDVKLYKWFPALRFVCYYILCLQIKHEQPFCL
jgi:hypothetical protein